MEKYNDEILLNDILIKLSEYKVFLLKKKFTIIIFSFLFSLIGIIFATFSDTEYHADLTFVVDQQEGGGLGNLSGLAGQFGFDLGSGSNNSTFSQSNVMELLKSRGVIVKTLLQSAKVNGKTDFLIEHYIKINKLKDNHNWNDYDFLKDISFHDNNDYIHDSISGVIWQHIIENNLSIELESNEANIITLSYISLNQEFAKEFVERLIGQMSMMYVAHATAQANNTLDFLQDRSDSIFLELDIAEQEFAKVKDINQRIIKATGRLKELQLMRRVEVLNTIYLELIKNLEISKMTLLNKTPIINIIDEPVLPLEKYEFSKIYSALLAGFLGGFLSLCYFIFSKLFRDALTQS